MYKLDPQLLQQQQQILENETAEEVTEDMILNYTDCKRLQDVLVVSLRSKNLVKCFNVLSQCTNLQVAFLSHNRLSFFQDLNNLQRMNNLVKVNLSHNQIVLLPAFHSLGTLKNLRILMLDHNLIQNWSNLESLTSLSDTLYHLTLSNNPISQVSGYRHYLVTKLSGLKALDEYIITDEERMEDVGFGLRFRALSPFMRLYIPEFKEDLNAEQHLFQVELEIYKLKRLFEKNSPSIRIQSLFRGYKRRVAHSQYFEKRQKSIIYIQKMVRGWLQRLRMKRELRFLMKLQGLEYLTMTNTELMYYNARLILEKPFRAYVWRRRAQKLKLKMILRIQTAYRAFKAREFSYIKAMRIEEYPVIYFLKEQRAKFRDLIEKTCKNLKIQTSFTDIYKNFVSHGSEFCTLRYPDFSEHRYNTLMLVHNLMPSMITKVTKVNSAKLFQNTRRSTKFFMCQFGHQKAENIQKLQRLRQRNCGVDIVKMKRIIAERNKNYDHYQDFDSFFFPNLNFAKALINTVKDFNRFSPEKQVLMFFKYPLIKVQAAITIQTAFRHYLWRKNENTFKLIEQIIENRASLCLQSRWKNLKVTRRFKFLHNLKIYLEKIDSNVIYLEEQIYLQLPTIIQNINSRSTKFTDQFIKYQFDSSTHAILINNYKNPRFEFSILPRWVFDPKLETISKADDSITPIGIKIKNSVELYDDDIMALIHYTDGNIDSSLKDYNQIANYVNKTIDLKKGLKFIEISCSNVLEAKRRAMTIALLTFLLKNQVFIQVFTQKQIEEGFFLNRLRDLWEAFGFSFTQHDIIQMQRTSDSTYKQQLKGIDIILSGKDLERYAGQIDKDPYYQRQDCFLESGKGIDLYSNSFTLKTKPQILTKDQSETNLSNVEQFSIYDASSRDINASPQKFAPFKKVIVKPKKNIISYSQQVSPVSTSITLRTDIEMKLYEMSMQQKEEDFISSRDLTDRLNFAKLAEIENKRQDVSSVREFKDYIKGLGQQMQEKQLEQFIQFKREQKELISSIIVREKERKFFENLNKKLNVMTFKQDREKRREEVNFSKNLGAQLNMLNKVSLQAFRRKGYQDDIRERQHQHSMLKSKSRHAQSVLNNTQNINKVNLSDSFANYFDIHDSNQAKSTQISPRPQAGTYLVSDTTYGNILPTTVSKQQVRDELLDSSKFSNIIDSKYQSFIRQYERAKVTSKAKTQISPGMSEEKDIMVLNESVQLPAFPMKVTRNAFQRSYQKKRIIQVQMMENSQSLNNTSTYHMGSGASFMEPTYALGMIQNRSNQGMLSGQLNATQQDIGMMESSLGFGHMKTSIGMSKEKDEIKSNKTINEHIIWQGIPQNSLKLGRLK
ncbi:leucine-rich repeat and iq domain-containing protein 3 [Stylonychia lemnae]|uniref:Leucine-rich repeat and iq domain-containing protein 3 n=1 Tax=Stylonychia lemnae TaxID=5949 RepID=A0A078ASY3_STYLE|nr:leucine-rich repeat and iq domain-containing protein 3 [Stylonychia lemnae]|eukprot:CDW85131.1 leucine-rich repeat and iq domain-containing protein 3 [Stylonychia lemnae]